MLSARFVQLARDAGALSVLPLALTIRTGMDLFAGRFAMASSLVDEMAAVNAATGADPRGVRPGDTGRLQGP